MRVIGMVSLADLILAGFSPAAVAPAAGAAQRHGSAASREDPDARCRPFLEGFAENDANSYGRGRMTAQGYVGTSRNRSGPSAPPPPPPRASTPAAAARPDGRSGSGGAGPDRGHGHAGRAGLCRRAGGSRALCGPGGRRRPCGRRRAGLDLLDRRRHRLLRQCPAHAERRAQMPPAGRGADRGDAQLFPLRLSAAARPVAAVQRQRRHDDDAVEPGDAAAARRPARLRSAAQPSGRRRTSSSWSTSPAR